VVLVEKSKEICKDGASYANAGFHHTGLLTWTKPALLFDLMKCLLYNNKLVELKLKGVFYKNQMTWGINYFLNMPKSR